MKSIKYICKYVTTESDVAVIGVVGENYEVTQYQLDRYVSISEAIWCTVVYLAIHLKNVQWLYFTAQNALQ